MEVDRIVHAHTLQIIARRDESGWIAAQVFVVIAYVEAQREENIVPDEHLHFCLLARIDGHHVSIDYSHSAASGCGDKITMHLKYARKISNTSTDLNKTKTEKGKSFDPRGKPTESEKKIITRSQDVLVHSNAILDQNR